MADKRLEELWCHDCQSYVQFTLDYDLDGRHILNCPKCGHEHYRIIRDGRITAERWGQDPRQNNMRTYNVTNCATTATSIWISSAGTTAAGGTTTAWIIQ